MKRLQVVVLLIALSIFCYLVFSAQKIKKEELQLSGVSGLTGELSGDLITSSQNLQIEQKFVVLPTGKGEFQLLYSNKNERQVNIQVYDIIGNLLLEEELDHHSINRHYDLSESGSRLFMVRLDDQKSALIKKVSAG